MKNLLETARELDQQDVLAGFRDQFHVPLNADGSEQHYFCGHSLGLQPKTARKMVEEELEAWRRLAVHGHFEGDLPWMDYNEHLSGPLAELTGARPDEIVVMNTLSVNLHLLMVSFFRPGDTRKKILIEKHAFPSDRYAVASQLRFHGLDPSDCLVELGPENGGKLIDEGLIENFLEQQGHEIALVLWPGVQYVSGQAFDLARVAAAARRAGAMIGFDLAHSIGNLPLSLHDSGCDFAAWCHYKYLNAGPGAVGGCFIHERHHQDRNLPRFHGWWGNRRKSRFDMAPEFEPASGAAGWELSNPPILSMAPLRASLAIHRAAGMKRLREKSVAMSAYLVDGIETQLDDLLEILTPLEPARRGSQISLRVRSGREDGRGLFQYLMARGVVTDWREPDVIRVAPIPLYNRFADCYAFLRHTCEWAGARGSPARQSV